MWQRRLRKDSVYAHNVKHKGQTIWYKATVSFDMILIFLSEHNKNTKETSLQDFQRRLTQYIDDFINNK